MAQFGILGCVQTNGCLETVVKRQVSAMLNLCDDVLIIHHESAKISNSHYELNPNVQVFHTNNLGQGHDILMNLSKNYEWIFSCDDDEFYEPYQLCEMRRMLLEGAFDSYYRIYPNYIHIIEHKVDILKGYISPYSLSMASLWNVNKISTWTNGSERLHGGICNFVDEPVDVYFDSRYIFAESTFRCFHFPFKTKNRLNYSDLISVNSGSAYAKILKHVGYQKLRLSYKNRFYKKGPMISLPTPETMKGWI